MSDLILELDGYRRGRNWIRQSFDSLDLTLEIEAIREGFETLELRFTWVLEHGFRQGWQFETHPKATSERIVRSDWSAFANPAIAERWATFGPMSLYEMHLVDIGSFRAVCAKLDWTWR
ncbi:hypothetical protein P2H44_02310 [Albimonas sp. CAU 1670]|uniref:hypothetical protein n=1 Tax=Albimonas sp. CAU 1670 TaxID=3032599 RepID=UPI0023DC61AF|nr:hypothetical protein [Albimonas sp. CAU 1670]MDF2231377.1 hypothetical protein [Albimonas sp. CAU 1670]